MLRCKVNDRVDDAVLHQATGILLDVDAWIDDSPGLAKFFTHFIGSDWQAMKEGEGKSKGRFKNIRCGGKSVARELCGDYPVARRVAAVQRFRVRAEVFDETRRSRRSNAERVGGLRDVKPK